MDNFVNRLEFLLRHYEFTASTFADKIGVQRSSLSHLLSGRNKPSLDFIMKIYEAFPELNMYWLLKGDGEFLAENATAISVIPPSLFSEENQKEETRSRVEVSKINSEEILSETTTPLVKNNTTRIEELKIHPENPESNPPILDIKKIRLTKEIEQIVIFYKDGSFSHYTPN